ncbi:enoyl-CoA hydratase/isomerase family protein [Rhodococcus sp. G-MC3]|uniref:enoyl-CoA hydratase/isomerase family protein n=1 Tax=Rhodococcus sp. G-MC3 TaxID=3046209 RepID=UPI0024BBBD4B|nr:enoyl-CoA hydratase/isomerase family protein [Rhodococcus sp. G-MC3]MDJ0394781.1 enoyl-CoA hydratase/isomerase family protein [Rhodococcus sp. G-MC3]
MNTLVVEELSDRVVVTLAREKQRNAIDAEMISELHEVCALIEDKPKLLLLTGQGEHFAGGADINQLRVRTRDDALRGINRNLFDRIATLPLPTVAAIRGYALGGGAELSYACDIRIISSTAVFGNPEPGLGIMAAAGASYRLPTLIGVSVAKQVLLGGRTLDADAALRSGLAMEIVEDPLAAAHSLLDRVAKQAPLALKLTKKILDAPGSHPWADDIAQAILFETEDKQRRMTAFLEKL